MANTPQDASGALDLVVDGASQAQINAARDMLNKSVQSVSDTISRARMNTSSNNSSRTSSLSQGSPKMKMTTDDQNVYTSISDMINSNQTATNSFGTVLDNLYLKNKKYYTIIKDYEIMPFLLPQINRVLMFLVNECLSPDIQNEQTFLIKYTGSVDDKDGIQKEINEIKKEMNFDNVLREVYYNRYKLGHDYYLVVDYGKTFDKMSELLAKRLMGESAMLLTESQYIDTVFQSLSQKIDSTTTTFMVECAESVTESSKDDVPKTEMRKIPFSLENLGIIVERSSIAGHLQEAHAEVLNETYSQYSLDNMLNSLGNINANTLNESTSANIFNLSEGITDNTKFASLINNLKKKKLRRCSVVRQDPAKLFHLTVPGGRGIGYFKVTDITTENASMVNFAQSLKDTLLKSRVTNMQVATQTAEEAITKDLAEKIINAFDPNIGISRIEDIDLLHDFIQQNAIFNGNKKITFYYEDEIFDMSRADGSILTNAVFFTKLYTTLMMNNIQTKILRGRGRQIHTINMGVSNDVKRYVQYAIASLTMPDSNIGMMNGSFEQLMNTYNSASDIIIPVNGESEQVIRTDYIPGQDVNMDEDFLRMLLNGIVSSMGFDSAIIDATSGNLQFARTLTMESLQISNAVRNEQQDLHDSWEKMCLRSLTLMGSDKLREAIEQNQISVQFFEPKSLILQNTLDELNNAKTFAENMADIQPILNMEGMDYLRYIFIFMIVKSKVNIDWGKYDKMLTDSKLDNIDTDFMKQILETIRSYQENTKQEMFGNGGSESGTDADDDELSKLMNSSEEL